MSDTNKGPYAARESKSMHGYSFIEVQGLTLPMGPFPISHSNLLATALNAAYNAGAASTNATRSRVLTDAEIERVGREMYRPDAGLQTTRNTYFKAGLRYARDHGYLAPHQPVDPPTSSP